MPVCLEPPSQQIHQKIGVLETRGSEKALFFFKRRMEFNYSLRSEVRGVALAMNRRAELKKGDIQKRVLIQAPAAIVFSALTDARDLVRWFCDRASSDPREGGELNAYWKSGKAGIKGRARYVRIDPDSAVDLLWIDDGQGVSTENATHTLSYSIRPRSNTSEVIMCDRDDTTLDEDALALLDSGWNSVLLALKDFCERKARANKPHPSEDT